VEATTESSWFTPWLGLDRDQCFRLQFFGILNSHSAGDVQFHDRDGDTRTDDERERDFFFK
jgi:hypothetical protein